MPDDTANVHPDRTLNSCRPQFVFIFTFFLLYWNQSKSIDPSSSTIPRGESIAVNAIVWIDDSRGQLFPRNIYRMPNATKKNGGNCVVNNNVGIRKGESMCFCGTWNDDVLRYTRTRNQTCERIKNTPHFPLLKAFHPIIPLKLLREFIYSRVQWQHGARWTHHNGNSRFINSIKNWIINSN